MDSFKIGVFDVFSSIIPGLPILILLVFSIENKPFSIDAISLTVSEVNLASTVFLGILSYVIGFTFQYISYEFFKFIFEKSKIWKKRKGDFEISIGKRGEEICLIREVSPENYKTLNIFLALRAMCYNLSFTLLVFFMGMIILTITIGEFHLELNFVLLLSLIFSFILFRRAVSFHEWSQSLITESNKVSKEILKLKNS